MLKITYATVFHLYQDEDTKKWEIEEESDYRETCSNAFDIDASWEFDSIKYNQNLAEEFAEKFGNKEGYVRYYVEFTVSYYEQCTMDGTEYDSDYEIIEDECHWLGGEDWLKE